MTAPRPIPDLDPLGPGELLESRGGDVFRVELIADALGAAPLAPRIPARPAPFTLPWRLGLRPGS